MILVLYSGRGNGVSLSQRHSLIWEREGGVGREKKRVRGELEDEMRERKIE